MSGDLLARLDAALAERFHVMDKIGEGGMATVFLAQDTDLARYVAIKVFDPEVSSGVRAERFVRETKIGGKLHHFNVMPIYEGGEAGGLLYYVMRYVRGGSLRRRLEREGQLTLEDAVRITFEVAKALDYAHRRGVIHRDIKPENILLDDGRALVADFGIALALWGWGAGATDSPDDVKGSGRLTKTGHGIGTPIYISPEQAGGEELDLRADIYSLCCVFYEMLAGKPPFTGPTAQAIIAKHIIEEPPSLLTVRPSLPVAVAEAISRGLAKARADRFDCLREFMKALAVGLPF